MIVFYSLDGALEDRMGPPKNRLRATAGRALYYEIDLPLFATLLFGYVSRYSLSFDLFVL